MTNEFYKYIQKRGDSYSIVKRDGDKVERWGTYSKLTDALYERDRLIESDWDWDDYLAMEETDNPYENMELPELISDTKYIFSSSHRYKVYLGREYKGTFNNKTDAYAFADEFGGRVVNVYGRHKIQKSINGKVEYFGQYPTLAEAQKVRDELIENGWKK